MKDGKIFKNALQEACCLNLRFDFADVLFGSDPAVEQLAPNP